MRQKYNKGGNPDDSVSRNFIIQNKSQLTEWENI